MSETTEETTAAPQPGSAIAVRRPHNLAASVPAKLKYAQALADSGLLPAQFRRQPGNVLYAVEYGEMLGLAPMAAITGIHVIEGKPTASAGLISALVRRAGHTLRVRGNAQSATCTIIRCDDPGFPFEVTWTLKRNSDGNPSAEEAGLLSKGTWKNYPASMLKSRVITQCARDACEEALFGLHYTPEEMGAAVDADGEVVEAEIVDDDGMDHGWLEQSLDRVPSLTTKEEIAALWSEAIELVKQGRISQSDAAAVQAALRERIAELNAAEQDEAAGQEPAAEAVQADPAETLAPDDPWLVAIYAASTNEDVQRLEADMATSFDGKHDTPRYQSLAAVLRSRAENIAQGVAA